MAKRKTPIDKQIVPAAAPPVKLEKAQSPIIHVPSKANLFEYEAELQKSNVNMTRFETLFQAAKLNAWANRAINVVAASVVANGWKPQPLNPAAKAGEPGGPNPGAEAALLRFLSQPNDEDSFEDVITRIVCDLLTCGNSFWEVPRLKNTAKTKKRLHKMFETAGFARLAKDSEYALVIEDAFDSALQELDGLPLALFHIDARTISVQTNEQGRVQGYTQMNRNGKKVMFDKSEVIHFKLRGIGSTIYGESPLEPLAVDLAIDLYRQTYIKSMLENSTKLGYFFSMEGAQPDTIARFQEWLNIRGKGPANAGQNVVAEGTINVQALPPLPIFDEGSNSLSDSLKEKILTCMGIPVAKLGTMDSGSLGGQNQEGSNKTYIEATVKPLARMIERQFNLQLVPDFKVVGVQGYGIAILTEDVDILATRAETIIALTAAGIMEANEARVELRMVPFESCGDVPLIQTPGGLVRREDAEADKAPLDELNARIDALSGLVGTLQTNQASPDQAVTPATPATPAAGEPPQPKPPVTPVNEKAAKTLTDLAEALLKVLHEPDEG